MHASQTWWLGTCGLLFAANLGLAQEPVINGTVPGAIRPGAATNVVLQGGALNGASKLWTNFPVTAVLAPGIEGNGTNAAATAVTQHDDVLHAQSLHREFKRRGRAMMRAVRLVGRRQIRDIAQHEHFAGARIEDHFRRDAAVAAADQHDFGRLAIRHRLIAPPFPRKAIAEKAPITRRQPGRKHE
mgnify:CR=1 FL=1